LALIRYWIWWYASTACIERYTPWFAIRDDQLV
jgi:hypothetical protein